jgi:hypothetical protein
MSFTKPMRALSALVLSCSALAAQASVQLLTSPSDITTTYLVDFESTTSGSLECVAWPSFTCVRTPSFRSSTARCGSTTLAPRPPPTGRAALGRFYIELQRAGLPDDEAHVRAACSWPRSCAAGGRDAPGAVPRPRRLRGARGARLHRRGRDARQPAPRQALQPRAVLQDRRPDGGAVRRPAAALRRAPRVRDRRPSSRWASRLLPDRRRLHQLGQAQRRARSARAAARAPARWSRTRSASPTSIRCATTCCSSASSIPSACRCPTSTSTSARTAATASSTT